MSGQKYKVVFVDWFQTLSPTKFWWQSEHTQFETILFGKLGHMVVPWMRGEYTLEEVAKALNLFTEIDEKMIVSELKESCETMKLFSSNMPNLIKDIRNMGVKVVIATDNMDCFTRWTIKALKINSWVDEVLDSYTLKALKKDTDETGKSKFFADFLKRNELKPGECLLIDDMQDKNLIIAKSGIDLWKVDPTKGGEEMLRKFLAV